MSLFSVRPLGPKVTRKSNPLILSLKHRTIVSLQFVNSPILNQALSLKRKPCIVKFGMRSGRFFADDYFTILYGEQWAYSSGSLEKEIYRPGDQHILPRGTAKQYKMPDSAWALEYARGNIVSMLPFGFADTFSSTLDFWTLFDTISISAFGIVRELFRFR